jgi:thiol-disulfide isomerase/thioredoxin
MYKSISLFVLFFGASVAVQAQGIDFFHGTWSEAKAKAQAEGKLIFVDAYAVWCGPCKRMSAVVFPDSKAGDFFNPNFINLKIDMEHADNAEFAGKYPVGSYPTLLFLDPEGKVVLREIGARDVNGLVELGRKALGKTNRSAELEKQYNEGNRDPKFLTEYVRALNMAGKPSLKIVNEYLATQKNLDTEANLRFIYEGTTEADSRVFDLLVKHYTQAGQAIGLQAINARIEQACRATLKKAIAFKNTELLAEAKNKLKSALPERAQAFGYDADMKYYAATKDAKNYLKSASGLYKNEIKGNAAKSHELVISVLRAFPEDEKALEQVEKWAETAAETANLPEYYLTWADVCKRRNNAAKARDVAEKARKAAGKDDRGIGLKIDYFLQQLEEGK